MNLMARAKSMGDSKAASDHSEVRIIHTVGETIAVTSRSSLELLTLPFPFSQVGLLTADEFLRAVAERRIKMWAHRDLDITGLEELHKRKVLVPMFCVSIEQGDSAQRVDTTGSLTRQHVHATIISELYAAAEEGRATDPSAEPFEAWPTERVRTLWPSTRRGYLYSYHQLLGLERARSLVETLRPRERVGHRSFWRLDPINGPDEQAQQGLASWRSLAITLSAIDTRVWPHITQVISQSDEVWRSSNLSQTPEDLLGWLELTTEQLRKQSKRLRWSANFDDVLGDFYDLVRRAKPEAWNTLRGQARTAMDDRMAAEVLDRFADELLPEGHTPETPRREHLSMQGLNVRERSLDAVLTDLHVSPHPPLVIGLEGATEMTIVPKVMRVLGIQDDPTWVRLVNFGGTSTSLGLLARFAAEPVLGEDRGEFVMLDRPVTRFLVLTDAENNYKTAKNRRAQRKLLLDSITAPLPRNLRPDLYTKEARIVEIMTWGKYPWEFAHFTDAQLADALLKVACKPHPKGRTGLIHSINRQRTADPSPNIDDAWKTSGVSKTDLADALWPLLEARIERAIERGTTGPPVMKAMLRAHELASLSYRLSMSVRRH
jgi:hypothetical protein